jgi:tetratricopeptide (TPR) repeat protein
MKTGANPKAANGGGADDAAPEAVASEQPRPGAQTLLKLLRGWRPYVLLAGVTALMWAHTLAFQFVWDDYFFIQRLESIRSLRHIPTLFYSLAAQSSYPQGFVLFRPLRTAHYALLVALGGGTEPRPWLFHLANVLWHGAAALLFFSVARKLLGQFKAAGAPEHQPAVLALLSALALAVHPVVTEVVCWAKSLDDLMATVFTLAALRLLLVDRLTRPRERAALGCFVLAVYAKESALPFAGVAGLVFYYVRRQSRRQSCRQALGYFAVAAMFAVHHHLVVGRTAQAAPLSGSYLQTLVDMLPVVTKYFRLLWGLPPFCIDYSYLQGGYAPFAAAVLAGLTLLVALAALGAWCLVKARPPWTLAGLGVAWVGLFLLPVSNLVPMMQYLAERFLYLPLVGWLLALAALLGSLRRWQWPAGIYALLIILWASLARDRSQIWKDEVALFVTSAMQEPHAQRVVANAVAAVLKQPHLQPVFQVEQLPDREPRLVLADPRRLKKANWPAIFNTLDELQRLFPGNYQVLTAHGIAFGLSGQPAKAAGCFEAATRLRPRDDEAWSNLGQAWLEANQKPKAREAFGRALALNRRNAAALRSMASLSWQEGDYQGALAFLRPLRALEPGNPEHQQWIEAAEAKLKAAAPGPEK